MRTTYPSNLTDAEWGCLQRHLPAAPRRGSPRTHPLRTILNAFSTCSERAAPGAICKATSRAFQTVFYHFRRWHLRGDWHGLFTALRAAERQREDSDPHLSAAIMDAQSVKTVEESASISSIDAHKCVKGRKRQRYGGYLGAAALGLRYPR